MPDSSSDSGTNEDITTGSGTNEDTTTDSGTGSDTGSDAGSTTGSDDDGSGTNKEAVADSGTGSDTGSDAGSTKEESDNDDDDKKEESKAESKDNSGSDSDSHSGSEGELVEEEVLEESVHEEEVVDEGLPTVVEEGHEDVTGSEAPGSPVTTAAGLEDGESKDGKRALPEGAADRDLEANEEEVEQAVRFMPVQKEPKEDDGSNIFVTFFCCVLFLGVLVAAIAAPIDLMDGGGGKTLQATEISRGTGGGSNVGPTPTVTTSTTAPAPPTTPTSPTSSPVAPMTPTSPTAPTSPTVAPTAPMTPPPVTPEGPTGAPTTVNLGQFLGTFLIPRFGEAPFEDPSSAEFMAADHMSSNDPYIFQGPVEDEDELGDRYALTAVYYALNGDTWTSCGLASENCFAENWLVGDHCVWTGVACNEDKRVTSINFSIGFTGGTIAGTIPPAITLLTKLEEFKLISSEVTGFLPNEFLGLTNLQILDLTDLDLNGPIPRGLGDLSNLETLFLAQNEFTGTVPVALGSLLDLRSLTLDGNQLLGSIPNSLCILGLNVLSSSCDSTEFACDCCTSCS